ncbi:FAD-dependent oxidoreductase [Patescibacteria group bacterium]|nr:MAG: FAD-dependent oxidoreductase [Patescibacteria group bacterium]
MIMAVVDYLIVGGGVAGTTAAETLRRLRPNAAITIVSAEPYPLYSRVLLPHLVLGKASREKIFLRQAEQYREKGIEFLAGVAVAELRPGEHTAVIVGYSKSDNSRILNIRYHKLLLATGGAALPLGVPGEHLLGVTPFRSLHDAEAIIAALSAMPNSECQALAVGGSFISLEFPPFFEKFGLAGGMLLRGERFWRRILDDEASGVIEDTLLAHNIRIYKGEALVACEGERRLESVRLADGRRLKTSFLGYGVGLAGAPEFVLQAGIAGGPNGIAADERLRTSAPDVWAAGDCADFWDVTVGRRHRLGNWLNAQEQGRFAAEAMAGEKEIPFESVSAYATKIFECSIAMIGDLTSQAESRWLTRGTRANGKVARLHLRGGKLAGAALINILTERAAITTLIKNRTDLRGREKDLADPSFGLQNFF